jgi:hypothetical protein
LLFVAWLFPLLLKRRLSELGAYTWTKRDERRLATFEVRLALHPEQLSGGWQALDRVAEDHDQDPAMNELVQDIIFRPSRE